MLETGGQGRVLTVGILLAVGYTGKNLISMLAIFFLNHFSVNMTNPKKFFKKSHFWQFAGQKTGILDLGLKTWFLI